jgi:hypothetical protein
VHLFTDQQQNVVIVTLDLVHPDVVIRDNDQINTGLGSGLGDLRVIPGTIGVWSVYVRISDDFVQGYRFLLECDDLYCTRTDIP